MRHSACLIFGLGLLSKSAFAEEQNFENFLLKSHSIVSPSQYYQVKGGRFEGLASSLSGSLKDKGPSVGSVNLSGYEVAAGVAQGVINNQLVVAAEVDTNRSSAKFGTATNRVTTTEIKPAVALSIASMVSVGAAILFVNDEEKLTGADAVTTSFNVFTLGATAHLDAWEASFAVTTENKDDVKTQANSPQTLALHGRYKFNPALTLGGVYSQRDFAHLAPPRSTAEAEANYGLVLESALADHAAVEVAFISTNNRLGLKDDAATTIDLKGFYKVNPSLQVGAWLVNFSSSSDAVELQLNKFGLLASVNF